MLFGVAGGFAEWLDMDPALVRIVWALLVLAGGAGFLLYIVAAIVIPEAPYGMPAGAAAGGDAAGGAMTPGADPATAANATSWGAGGAVHRRDGNGALVFGGLLVIIGGWFLLRDLLPAFDDRLVLPGFLIVIGVFLLLGSMRRR
jgi:phage shock protein C